MQCTILKPQRQNSLLAFSLAYGRGVVICCWPILGTNYNNLVPGRLYWLTHHEGWGKAPAPPQLSPSFLLLHAGAGVLTDARVPRPMIGVAHIGDKRYSSVPLLPCVACSPSHNLDYKFCKEIKVGHIWSQFGWPLS